jgi:hypothetical protein
MMKTPIGLLPEQLLGGIQAALKPNCWPDNGNWNPDNRGGIPSKSGRIKWRAAGE